LHSTLLKNGWQHFGDEESQQHIDLKALSATLPALQVFPLQQAIE
jgi:hypothetical protein